MDGWWIFNPMWWQQEVNAIPDILITDLRPLCVQPVLVGVNSNQTLLGCNLVRSDYLISVSDFRLSLKDLEVFPIQPRLTKKKVTVEAWKVDIAIASRYLSWKMQKCWKVYGAPLLFSQEFYVNAMWYKTTQLRIFFQKWQNSWNAQ